MLLPSLAHLKGSFAPCSASCASASASCCAVRTALTAMRSSLDSRSAPPRSLYSLLPCATCLPEPAHHMSGNVSASAEVLHRQDIIADRLSACELHPCTPCCPARPAAQSLRSTCGVVSAAIEHEGSSCLQDLCCQEPFIDRLSQHVECCHAQPASQVLPLSILNPFRRDSHAQCLLSSLAITQSRCACCRGGHTPMGRPGCATSSAFSSWLSSSSSLSCTAHITCLLYQTTWM